MEGNTRAAEGLRFGCPGCGSGLRYDIASGRMRCGSCGQSYALSDIPDPSAGEADGMMEAVEYRCPQCGAAVHASQTAAAGFCSYCGADVILTQRLTRVARPAKLVPFRVTREKCEQIYRRRVKDSRCAPDDFTAQQTIDHFRPVYIPFWRYRGTAGGDGLAGTAVNRYSDNNYEYTNQYQYAISGSVSVSGVIYDASVSFEDETARQLRFSTQRAVPFHPGYLCGFYAETPDTEPSLYEEGVRNYAQKAWEDEFAAQCKYKKPKAAFPHDSFAASADILLMPVWLLAHRSGGRVVYTAVNGDTGEIVCDTPVSNRRFGLLAAELAGLCAMLLVLLHFVIILRPRLLAALCGLTAAVAQWVIARVFRGLRIRRNRENDYTWLKLHPDPSGKIKKPVTLNIQEIKWHRPLLITGGVAAAGMVLSFIMSYNFNAFLAGLLADHSWLAPVLQSCALAQFVIAGYRRQGGLDDILFLARLAAMAATLLAVFIAAADISFYLCCVALLALTALSLARLNRAHNEYVSRPVPFFGKEEEQA